MANQDQLKILKQGVDEWNSWRINNPDVYIDLKGHNFMDEGLAGINLSGADLSSCDFTRASLYGANLSRSKFYGSNFIRTILSKANLRQAHLRGANLSFADLKQADLSNASLYATNLYESVLTGANLTNARLVNAHLAGANFGQANLTAANLCSADMYGTNLDGAILSEANLENVNLNKSIFIDTIIEGAILKNCHVFGFSVWNIKGEPKEQANIVITPPDQAEITVDDIQVAQFVYLLLNNRNVRNVVDTITSKAVLILGRFTQERKEVLDLVRQELSKYDYVPILFDFENTQNQSLLETVMTLAGMCQFVVADITAATMVREELTSIVKNYPAKPVVSIMLQGETACDSIREMSLAYKSILPIYEYKGGADVSKFMYDQLILPAKRWLEDRRFQIEHGGKTLREIELENQIKELRNQLETNN